MFIIASVGSKTFSENQVRRIILAGADALRYSFSFDTFEKNVANLEVGLRVIEELNSSVKIAINILSNKIRIGDMPRPIMVKEGDELTIQSWFNNTPPEGIIPVPSANVAKKVYVGQITTIDHGKTAIQVTGIVNNETINIKVLNDGIIQPSLSLNLPQENNTDIYLQKFRLLIEKLKPFSPTYLSVPFINLEANNQIKKVLEYDNRPKIFIRIEDQNAIDHLPEICADNAYSHVIINRGELGENLPFEKLGLIQKQIIAFVKKSGKKTIVSSQIMEGTIYNYVPYRSDILDLTNLILDGADGIMLRHETALSTRPAYTISAVKKIIIEVERHKKVLNSK